MILEINLGDINTTTLITVFSIIFSYFKLSDNLGWLGNIGKYIKKLNFLRTKTK